MPWAMQWLVDPLFAMFKQYAQEVEESVGGKVEWREADKATRIITLYSYDISNESQWSFAFEWLMNKALIFKRIAKQFDK